MKYITLLIDDCSPFNLMQWHEPNEIHVKEYSSKFQDLLFMGLQVLGAKGKVSLTPYPGEQTLNVHFMESFVERYCSSGNWDFTLEGMTHTNAYGVTPAIREDDFFNRETPKNISDYIINAQRYAISVLRGRTVPEFSGYTSPWMSGLQNRKNYERGILDYFKETRTDSGQYPRSRYWYFLDVLQGRKISKPKKVLSDKEVDNKASLYHFPALVDDYWWDFQYTQTWNEEVFWNRVNFLLSQPDEKVPVISLLTHWQSLFGNSSSDTNFPALDAFFGALHRLKDSFPVEFIRPSNYIDSL